MRPSMRRWAAAGALVVALPLMADSCSEPTNAIDITTVTLITDPSTRTVADKGYRPLDTESQEGNFSLASGVAGTLEITFGTNSHYDVCTLDLDGRYDLPVEFGENGHFVVRKRTAALRIDRNINASLRCVAETGLAVPTIAYFLVQTVGNAVPKLAPAEVDVGSVDVGKQSRVVVLRLRNAGDTAFRTTRPWTSKPDEIVFSGTGCTQATVEPGGSCTFSIQVAPSMTGPFTARVGVDVFEAGAQASAVVVTARGTGSPPPMTVNPTSVDFGRLPVNGSGVAVVYSTNTGNMPMRVDKVTWTGSGNIQINWTTCASAVIAPQSACSTELRFTPTSPGQASGQLIFTGLMAVSPLTVNVAGTGVGTEPAPQPSYTPPTPP